MNINLIYNKGFKWYGLDKNVWVKGYGVNSEQFSFTKDYTEKEFYQDINKINGSFSLIVETNDMIYAAVDRVRSFPLYYSKINDKWVLSDNPNCILEKAEEKVMDELSKVEFLLTGYVTGKNTLYSTIKQLQAGEYLVYNKQTNNLSIERYFGFRHSRFTMKDELDLTNQLDNVHVKVFDRLIKSLNGRTVVLPLSGGYDSRLIAVMLNRLGYKNVICFSYGKKNNWESKISKEVADFLGYKWLFIPYSRKKMYEMYSSAERKEYSIMASGFNSLAHIQDWFAVSELKSKKLIPDNSIFVPGHAGDFVAGSHIPRDFIIQQPNFTQSDLNAAILKTHYCLWDWQDCSTIYKKYFEQKIEEIVGHDENYNSEEIADQFEYWDWKERQSKYICNSVRVYDFFDYEWRLPLWDNDIINFWLTVPVDKRYGRKLFFEYTSHHNIMSSIPTNPKRSKILNLIGRYTNLYYASFTGNKNIIAALNGKSGKIFGQSKYKFINDQDYIVRNSVNAYYALSNLIEIDNKNF